MPFLFLSLLSFLYIGDFNPINSVSRFITWSVTQSSPIPLQLTAQLDHSNFLRLISAATPIFFPSAIFLTPSSIHYSSINVLYAYEVQHFFAKGHNSDKVLQTSVIK